MLSPHVCSTICGICSINILSRVCANIVYDHIWIQSMCITLSSRPSHMCHLILIINDTIKAWFMIVWKWISFRLRVFFSKEYHRPWDNFSVHGVQRLCEGKALESRWCFPHPLLYLIPTYPCLFTLALRRSFLFIVLDDVLHLFWQYFFIGVFLSDPGKPGVRSLGPDVRHSLTHLCET